MNEYKIGDEIPVELLNGSLDNEFYNRFGKMVDSESGIRYRNEMAFGGEKCQLKKIKRYFSNLEPGEEYCVIDKGKRKIVPKAEINIEPEEGAVSVGELYRPNKKNYYQFDVKIYTKDHLFYDFIHCKKRDLGFEYMGLIITHGHRVCYWILTPEYTWLDFMGYTRLPYYEQLAGRVDSTFRKQLDNLNSLEKGSKTGQE